MYNNKRVTWMGYFEDLEAIRLAEEGKLDVTIKTMEEVDSEKESSRPKSPYSYVGRYIDNGRGESKGYGWHYCSDQIKEPWFQGLISNGQTISSGVAVKLAEGLDPRTLKHFRSAIQGKDKHGRPKQMTVAFDHTFSSPKSFSELLEFARIEAAKIAPDDPIRLKKDLSNPVYVVEIMEEAHKLAVMTAFDHAAKNHIYTRMVPDGAKNRRKAIYVPALELASAIYAHRTNRLGDMQQHSHGVMFNICNQGDGKIRTIDNYHAVDNAKAIDAIFKTTLASYCHEKLGVALRHVKEGNAEWCEIGGISDELIVQFSKRREEMKKTAKKMGKDISNPAVADFMSIYTRPSKDTVPSLAELQPIWEKQLHNAGYTYESFIASIAQEAEEQAKERAEKPVDVMAIAREVLAEITETQAAFEEKTLRTNYWNRLQSTGLDAAAIIKVLDDLKKSDLVVWCGENLEGVTYYSTPEMVAMEHEMLQTCLLLKGIHHSPFVSDEVVEAFIRNRQTLTGDEALDALGHINRAVDSIKPFLSHEQVRAASRLRERMTKHGTIKDKNLAPVLDALDFVRGTLDDKLTAEQKDSINAVFKFFGSIDPIMSAEQAEAMKAILGPDGVVVVQGRPGTGKTLTLASVVRCVEMVGKKAYGITPAWKSTGVLQAETHLGDDNARAITGFLNKVNRGEIVLDKDFVIVVDEAGMVGTRQMAALVKLARSTGCKLALVGDTKQISAVPAGQPMKAIAAVVGETVISKVRRQKSYWMRQASEGFATGHALESLKTYDAMGHIKWCEDKDEATTRMVEDYLKDVIQDIEDIKAGKRKTVRTRLMIGLSNVEVRELNDMVRALLRDAGLIAPESEEFAMTVIGRGTNSPLINVNFCRGDSIILGETLEFDGIRYANGEIGLIEKIWRSEEDDQLYLTISFDNGKKVRTFSESDFWAHRAKSREGKKTEPLHPKLQHAWATTPHSGQGATVDQCYVSATRPTCAEIALVFMTRHREDVKVYVDTGRVHDTLMARKGIGFAVSRKGHHAPSEPETPEEAKAEGYDEAIKPPEPEGEEIPPVSDEEIRERVFKEMSTPGIKTNVSDWVGDINAWARSDGTFHREGAEQEAGGQTQSSDLKPEDATQKVEEVAPKASPTSSYPEVHLPDDGDAIKEEQEGLPKSAPNEPSVKSPAVGDLSLQVPNVSSTREIGVSSTKRTPMADRMNSAAPRVLPITLKMDAKKLNRLLDEVEGVGADKMAERNFKKHVSAAPSRVSEFKEWSEPPIREEDEDAFRLRSLIDFIGTKLEPHLKNKKPMNRKNTSGATIGTRYDFLYGTAKEHLVISQIGDHWEFWFPKSGDTGRNIDGWVAHRDELNMGDRWERVLAKKRARAEMGIKVARDGTVTIKPYVKPERPPEKPLVERLRNGWKNTHDYDAFYDPEDYKGGARRTLREVVSHHNNVFREAPKTTCEDNDHVSEYLKYNRGITPETQRHFARDIAIYRRKFGDNKTEDFRVMFALRHRPRTEGEYPPIVGYAMKGLKKPGDHRSPSKNTTGNSGSMHIMGNVMTKPSAILLDEAAVTAFSHWQKLPRSFDLHAETSEGKVDLRVDKNGAMLLAPTGQPGPEFYAVVFHYAELWPDVPFLGGHDNDLAGDKMFKQVADVIALARPNGLQIFSDRPDPRFNDHNNEILGEEMTEEEKAKIAADRKAYADKKTAEWEASLYRLAENSLAEKLAAAVEANPGFNMLDHEKQAYIDNYIQLAKAGYENPDLKLIPEVIDSPTEGINKHRINTPPRRMAPPPSRPVRSTPPTTPETETPTVSGPGIGSR